MSVFVVSWACGQCGSTGLERRVDAVLKELELGQVDARAIMICTKGHSADSETLTILSGETRSAGPAGQVRRIVSWLQGRAPSPLSARTQRNFRKAYELSVRADDRILFVGLTSAELVDTGQRQYFYDALLVEYQAFKKEISGNKIARRLKAFEAHLIRRFEQNTLNKATKVFYTSKADLPNLKIMAPSANFILATSGWYPEALAYDSSTTKSKTEIAYTGSVNYGPNRNAIEEIVENVLPLLDGVRLVVTGDGPNLDDPLLHNNLVTFTGRIDSVYERVGPSLALVLPIREGGGMRLKALEALAVGLPIVATRNAMSGIGAVAGEHYIEAESAEEFAHAIRLLQSDDDYVRTMTSSGKQLAKQFSWNRTLDRMVRELGERNC